VVELSIVLETNMLVFNFPRHLLLQCSKKQKKEQSLGLI